VSRPFSPWCFWAASARAVSNALMDIAVVHPPMAAQGIVFPG
jgi:hypothetical protein